MISFRLPHKLLKAVRTRHRMVLTVLALALVASAAMTWKWVSATREPHGIHKELLARQQGQPAARTAVKGKSGASAPHKATTGSRRSSSARGGSERSSAQRAVTDRTRGTRDPSKQAPPAPQGRQ
ncbi:MAG: hypothetical protein ABI728_07075 [Betaproteobacteria bacterium]